MSGGMGFSEDAAVEGPAIELFRLLGWDHANLLHEFDGESPEGRKSMREAILPKRLWLALQKLNPDLPPEALNEAAADRSDAEREDRRSPRLTDSGGDG